MAADEYLVLSSTGPKALTRLGLAPHAMHSVAMENNPEQRWLATAAATDFAHLRFRSAWKRACSNELCAV